jgi:hypothetical protein
MNRFAGAAVAGVAASVLLLAPPAFAQTATATVADSAEAWYSTPPVGTCSSPVGCPPVPVAAYPANTLHVGVLAGRTTAVTYVQPDLAGLPAGETATAGVMTLPLATVSGNGNSNDSSATIEACLATGPFEDGTQGSTATPPTADCSISATVKTGSTSFTLDLTPFLAAWNAGRAEYGIALLPDPAKTGPTSTWHVAFNGRRLPDAPHITSTLSLSAAASPAAAGLPPSSSLPSGAAGGTAASLPGSSGTVSGQPGAGGQPAAPTVVPSPTVALTPAVDLPAANPSAGAPSLAAPAPAPVTARRPRAAVLTPTAAASKGFRYPEVMLLPLAFAAGLVFVVRVLTSDAAPTRKPV